MEESINNSNIDNSLSSKDTESSIIYENKKIKDFNIDEQIINSIVLNLQEIIEENKYKARKDIFYLSNIPSISLIDYIKRIMKYTKMDISSLIIAIIYIDSFCNINKYILTQNNIYTILLSACLISIKFNEDIIVNFKRYSEIAGISIDFLKKLEFQMYLMLHFSLRVQHDIYKSYYDYFSNYSIPIIKNINN